MSTARPIQVSELYTPELFAEICKRIAKGEFLNHICKTAGMPAAQTVREWVLDDYDGCARVYARAREMQYDSVAEEAIAIADTPEQGRKVTTKTSVIGPVREETTGDMTEHRKLRIETRKWILGKLTAKYGEKKAVDLTISTNEDAAQRLMEARARAGLK